MCRTLLKHPWSRWLRLQSFATANARWWAPLQYPFGAREAFAKLLELPIDKVKVNITLLGGGYFFATHSGSDGLVSCAVTGERIARNEAQMDHRPPDRAPWKRSPLRAPRPLSLWRRLLRPPAMVIKREATSSRLARMRSPFSSSAICSDRPPHASRDSGKGSEQMSYPVPAP